MKTQTKEAAREQAKAERTAKVEERIEDYLAVDPMEMEIGVDLVTVWVCKFTKIFIP